MRPGLVVKKAGTARAGPPLNLVTKGGLTRDDKENRGVLASGTCVGSTAWLCNKIWDLVPFLTGDACCLRWVSYVPKE